MRQTTLLLLTNALLIVACSAGQSSPSPTAPTVATPPPAPPNPAPGPPPPALVTITGAGFVPLEVTTTVGSRVTFVNNDTRPHDMLGGPDHTRLDCPEIDAVGFIVAGQTRETGVFTAARTCDFHDHNNEGNPAFHGRIIVR